MGVIALIRPLNVMVDSLELQMPMWVTNDNVLQL